MVVIQWSVLANEEYFTFCYRKNHWYPILSFWEGYGKFYIKISWAFWKEKYLKTLYSLSSQGAMPQNLVRMEEDTFQRLGWKEQGSLQPQLHADGSGIVPGFMRVFPCFTRLCMWNINRTTLQRMPEQSPDKTEERTELLSAIWRHK